MLPVRRVKFVFADDYELNWSPDRPELACVANGVSLLMPHLEPFVASAVRGSAAHPSAPPTIEFSRQEMQHFRQHRALNDVLISHHPGLSRLDRSMSKTFARLGKRDSNFKMAFAVGAETVAYHAARWTENRRRTLFANTEPVASTLFLWHLAEEVEHKSVAHDAAVVSGVPGPTMVFGKLVALLVMAWFIFWSALALLWANKRLRHPLCHVRMAWWSVSFAFELLPSFAVSLLPGHDPRSLVDPVWYSLWLSQFDQESGSMPVWNSPIGADGAPAEVVHVA